MDQFLFKTCAMHAMQGILASQSFDHKFTDQPNKKKEVQIVDEAIKCANEMMKRFLEIDSVAQKAE